jgi:hypothetical protein
LRCNAIWSPAVWLFWVADVAVPVLWLSLRMVVPITRY